MTDLAELRQAIPDYLAAMGKFMAQHGQLSIYPWLLEHGESFGTNIKTPKGLRLMKQKECFRNSATTILHNQVDDLEWFYCEGYAASIDLGVPVSHAWIANKQGEVIDRTWRYKPGTCAYFGIPFNPSYLYDGIMERQVYALLHDEYRYNEALMGADPELFRAWEKVSA